MIKFNDIEYASKTIQPFLIKTLQRQSIWLSEYLGCQLFLKYENMQKTGSFKERGALNKLLSLSEKEKKNGIVAISAGNHAQAVALHATRLGIPSIILMPKHSPEIKIKKTQYFGATVKLHGNFLSDSEPMAQAYVRQGMTFIHPYDDEKIIIGQGTIALEMLSNNPELDVMLIPIGGGGLISGISIAAHKINPKIKIIGVQSAEYPYIKESLTNHTVKQHPIIPILADGIAVKKPGTLTLPIIHQHVDDIICVNDQEIAKAIVFLLQIEHTLVEGAGAAALAAILQKPERFFKKKIGILLSGGNIDGKNLIKVCDYFSYVTNQLCNLQPNNLGIPVE